MYKIIAMLIVAFLMAGQSANAQRIAARVNLPGISVGVNTGPGYYGYRQPVYYAPPPPPPVYYGRHYYHGRQRMYAAPPRRGYKGHYNRGHRVYRGCF